MGVSGANPKTLWGAGEFQSLKRERPRTVSEQVLFGRLDLAPFGAALCKAPATPGHGVAREPIMINPFRFIYW